MGRFLDWVARRGAPGSTARWALGAYQYFRKMHPDAGELPDAAIFRLMIMHRYARLPDPDKERSLLSTSDQLDGLMGLTVEILRIEASLADNTAESLATILGAVGQVIESSGLPRSVLFGSKHSFPEFVAHALHGPAA